MKLFDVKTARAEIEGASGAIRAIRAISPPSNSTNSTPPAAETGIPLDPEGLPFAACPVCGAGDFWKPSTDPFAGPGWACAECDPPPDEMWRHACAVPTKEGRGRTLCGAVGGPSDTHPSSPRRRPPPPRTFYASDGGFGNQAPQWLSVRLPRADDADLGYGTCALIWPPAG